METKIIVEQLEDKQQIVRFLYLIQKYLSNSDELQNGILPSTSYGCNKKHFIENNYSVPVSVQMYFNSSPKYI